MRRWAYLLGGLVCLMGAQPAQAQLAIGPQVAWSDDLDLGIGARLEFGLAERFGIEDGALSELFGMASGTYYFPSCGSGISCSAWEVNPNAAIPVRLGESLISYFGTGLHVARWSQSIAGESISDTDVGINILAGLKFLVGERNAFAEGKFGLAGAEHFSLTAGILLGGRR